LPAPTGSKTLNACCPLESFLAGRGARPQAFQRRAWSAYGAGESGLIHAPTGSGKTLAAWGGAVRELIAAPGTGLQYLWITPLRALAADSARALDRPLVHAGVRDAVALRTGDTSAHRKRKLMNQPPPALVTTPESLAVMLSYADAPQRLRNLRAVFVDEWHDLLDSKRGVLLQLALARLRRWNPGMKTWGLSATLGNLDEAAAALVGSSSRPTIIAGELDRPVELLSLLPDAVDRFPWAGRVGIRQLKAVVERIDAAETSLLFTNTRSQAEIWFNAIQAVCSWPDRVALHHGSIARELRQQAEQGLADGSLKCVVATASLDLGVDFSPVDQVLQVGSPKGIARLIQRAGRSGHQPGGTARIVCVPTHALEIAELAAVRERLKSGRVEPRHSLRLPLDVLAQHVVTAALGGGVAADELFEEARTTHAFAELQPQHWQWVLDFVIRGGPALEAYPAFQRVEEIDGLLRVPNRRIAMLHRLNIGTITADGALSVRFQKGGSLGQVEERFLARLRPGERFVFAGRVLELIRIRDMTAYVKPAKTNKAQVPAWQGGRLPLSTLLADGLLHLFEDYSEGCLPSSDEARAAAPLMALQQEVSSLPARGRLVFEQVASREGAHWFVYPFAGRLAHEGLAALLAWRIARDRPVTFSITINDYGLELLSAEPVELSARDWQRLFDPEHLDRDIVESLDAANLARYRFRDIARIAGLVQQGYPGKGKAVRQIQASSGLIFDVLSQYDRDNLLLDQARREVLEAQLDVRRIRRVLERSRHQEFSLNTPDRLTPLAFPLWADRLRAHLTSEDWQARVERMLGRLERDAA
jgi:ATP-dependent Lhr-like helicase